MNHSPASRPLKNATRAFSTSASSPAAAGSSLADRRPRADGLSPPSRRRSRLVESQPPASLTRPAGAKTLVAMITAVFAMPVRAAETQGAAAAAPIAVTAEDLHRETTQPAQIEPYERTKIVAKASGYASDVRVDIGDRVREGDVLTTLWIPEMEQQRMQRIASVEDAQAAVEQARAHVASADASIGAAEASLVETSASLAMHEANTALRQSEYDRVVSLVEQRAVTETLLDEKTHALRSAEAAVAAAQAAVRTAEADVEVARAAKAQAEADANRAEAQLNIARANLRHTEILMEYAQVKAPYDGLITERQVDTGDFVRSAGTAPDMQLYTIVRDDRLRVVFDIPESQASQVKIGQPVELVVDGLKGRRFEGTVSRTSGVLDPRTRTLRAEVDIDSTGTSLRPGMYGMATLTLADSRQALLIPVEAVAHESGQPFVHLRQGDRWVRRPVELGFVGRHSVEVLSGLRQGDFISPSGPATPPGRRRPASVASAR